MFNYKDGWIVNDNGFSYDTEYTKASVFAMCNGYMGSRGTFEEMEPQAGLFAGNYINGIYDAPHNLLREREIVNIQDWCLIKFWIDGEPFDLTTGTILSYKRWMDLRDAILHREVRWKTPKGKIVVLKTDRFVSMTEIHCALINWQIEAENECDITIESGINGAVTNIHKDHFKDFLSYGCDKYIYLETVTREMNYHIGTASADSIEASAGTLIDKKIINKNKKYICSCYSGHLGQGQFIKIIKMVSVYTSRDFEDVKNSCIKDLNKILSEGYEKIKASHINRWSELWKEADMAIEGDDKAQIGIRFSIYHLLNSAPYHSSSISYPARSLSGQDHRGSIFWDTEIFIAPFFINTLPEVALNMLMYRYLTLQGARNKAKSLGFKGAYYAWESHETGDEKCHSRVFRNPKTGRLIVSHFRDAQIHVCADIAYCIRQYYDATLDMEFITKYGAEMVCEIARFFASRVTYNKVKKLYMIKKVLGPDEYHELVDNNAFTNVMTKESISIALTILKLVKHKDHESYNDLCLKIGLDEDELIVWQDVYDRMYIPCPDKETCLIEQFNRYFMLEDCGVNDIKARQSDSSHYLGGKYGICTKTQIIKQADVIMLLYLMRDRYSSEVKKANFEYYEPRTENGSSLSPMAYSLVAADINNIEWSYKYFLHTAFMDLEAKGFYRNHGVHPCSLAGAWQTVVNGYCGITLKEDGVHWREPHMPVHWSRIRFTIKWHGYDILFDYHDKDFKATLGSSQKDTSIPFFVNGGMNYLTSGHEIVLEGNMK